MLPLIAGIGIAGCCLVAKSVIEERYLFSCFSHRELRITRIRPMEKEITHMPLQTIIKVDLRRR